MTYFECEDCGGIKEYMGNKLTCLEDRGLKFTQDVLIQSFTHEYGVLDKKCSMPTAPGSVLEKVKEGEESLPVQLQTYFQSGICKMIPVMQWNRPEISHSVHNLAKMTGKGNDTSIKAMHRCMEHCVGTPACGVILQPQGKRDGTKDYKFVLSVEDLTQIM